MSEAATQASTVVDCAGFKITISEDELRVENDNSPASKTPHILHAILLLAGIVKLIGSVGSVIKYLDSLLTLPDIWFSNSSLGSRISYSLDILYPLLLIWAFYAWYLWILRKGYNDLHCTRDNFESLNIFRGSVRTTSSYPKATVKNIQWSTTTFNTTPALLYTVSGKQMRVLDGLQVVEAQKILNQLDHLGYEVIHDVGMPMAVEIAEERRRSWLSS